MVYSTRRFVLCLSVCYFVLVFFSPFSIAITSLGEERANLSAFRTFVRSVLVWICRFPLPLGVWEGLRWHPWTFLLPIFGITKTRLFKIYSKFYLQNETFQMKKKQQKNFYIFLYFCSKHILWVLVRTSSARRF